MRHRPLEYGADTLPDTPSGLRLGSPYRREHSQHVAARDPVETQVADDRKSVGRKVLNHWSVCLPFFHRGKFAARTVSAASRKVGIFARRFSGNGSRPSATASRCASASWRALARVTAGWPPRPVSRRRPSMTIRKIQPLEPPFAMRRYSPRPAPCMPGSESAFAFAAVSAISLAPHFAHHDKREFTASRGHRQHNTATENHVPSGG